MSRRKRRSVVGIYKIRAGSTAHNPVDESAEERSFRVFSLLLLFFFVLLISLGV